MPRGRPREFDTDKALEAALQLFWRQGYEGTSVAALTKAMKIDPPSLYAAFGNKEMLFRKALERYLRSPASYLPNGLKEPTARGAVEKLFEGAINMAMNRRHPSGCMLVQGALASGPDADAVRVKLLETRAAAEAAVRRRFEQALAEGDLSKNVDPAVFARYITTVIWGLSVQAAGGASRNELKGVAEMVMKSWPRE